MIVEDIGGTVPDHKRRQFISNGVVVDSWVLTIFFVDSYLKNHPEKSFILNKCDRITEQQISCLNNVIINFQITTFVITPLILAEFLNHLRSYFKDVYKDILTEFKGILQQSEDLPVDKNSLLSHSGFCKYLNDVSLCIATEKQIMKNGYSCILSFDGNFINAFYRKNTRVLAFNLETLKYYYE